MAKPDWRELSGGGGQMGTMTPPIAERSRSEGDLNRNAYRNSEYPRLSVRAVCNDDGSPISEKMEELMGKVLAELETIRILLAAR